MILVTGSTFDNEMGIIPNVNVKILNENRSAVSNASGKFTIIANSLNSELRFSHAGYDFDTITVAEFKKLGYINLYPTTLDEVVIVSPINPNNTTKKTDNTWLWLLGITGLGFIGYKLASKKKAVNVTV